MFEKWAQDERGNESGNGCGQECRDAGGSATCFQGNNPGSQEINTLVAIFSQGRYAEAVALAQAMTERFPLHEFGWKALGAVFQADGAERGCAGTHAESGSTVAG